MAGIVALYAALKNDERLQRDWERNQPRLDRALESPLIARTPREVATAALLAIKLKFEPCAVRFRDTCFHLPIMKFIEPLEQRVATRLFRVVEGTDADQLAKAAVLHSLAYYADRAAEHPLVRLPWSDQTLQRVAAARPEELINPFLKPTAGVISAGTCIANLCGLFLAPPNESGDDQLRRRLRSNEFPGLGPERADAVGVFAFRRPWPIVDEYLWRVLYGHHVINNQEAEVQSYDTRRRILERHWRELLSACPDDPNQVAATLYLWADEASKFGYQYDLSR